MHLSANEIDVKFQYRYADQVRVKYIPRLWLSSDVSQQYPKAIRLVAGGLINLKPLVTHRFKLEEAVQAFHVAADPNQGAIKVQILD
jgi:L-iditol 2-dehydrogenase